MILPLLNPNQGLSKDYQRFLDTLSSSEFSGDIETSYGSRLAMATDNSVYQKLPQAVVFPRTVEDCQILGTLASKNTDIVFSARGGGTGTNGQSLSDGIIVDIRRYMNQVLELNVEEGWVRVQTGIVKDSLNDILKPYGMFFSPDLSTSNRATIGGMISTDASGQGSLVYGKTSDHVKALTVVLANGETLHTYPMPLEEAQKKAEHNSTEGTIYKQALATSVDLREVILAKFPRLNRFLTGYDLEHVYDDKQHTVDIGRLVTGAEGSLCMVAEATLSLTPIPKHTALINIKYDSFDSALRHAPEMVKAEATSVETIDSTVLNLAKTDIIWHSIKDLITEVPNKALLGINMVEYNSDCKSDIDDKIQQLESRLSQAIESETSGVIGYQITYDKADIGRIYAMRKKAVGLLGKTKGERKPIAFAEDTAVPPEKLADFICEFRALLDSHNLKYGMFGHVDAGVLHVRPALDLCDIEQEKLMHRLSDKVVELVAKYGGLMWGEHGKGYRSEYSEGFFGPELFTELRKIKRVFDPHNQMNPGKICTPLNSTDSLVSVKDSKRATFDRTIPIAFKDAMGTAMSCNGNGLCFNYDVTSPMCPSSKITSDRRHTPKGRAGMIREWLRLLSQQDVDTSDLNPTQFKTSMWRKLKNTLMGNTQHDFSHEVMDVMNGCLACKSCTSQCPVNVDVPDFRAKFIALYYQRYMRPLKDYMVANIESIAPVIATAPKLFNGLTHNPLIKPIVEKTMGYVDMPKLSSPSLKQRTKTWLPVLDVEALGDMALKDRENLVAIVQDPFTSFYEAQVVEDFARVVKVLGYQPILLPFQPNGKAAHVKGFAEQFASIAKKTAKMLSDVAKLDIPMVGMDASMVLCYRDEYRKVLSAKHHSFNVFTCHEWLQKVPEESWPKPIKSTDQPYALLSHCTEKTALPNTEKQWQQILSRVGVNADVIAVGCCGMAGTYGHEKQHQSNSKGLYELSWKSPVDRYGVEQLLVTGFSCRSQVSRYESKKPIHPITLLCGRLL